MTSEFAERFRQKCFSKFGIQMEVAECLRALTMAFELHKANISACENRSAPIIEHNPSFDSPCDRLEQEIAKYALPLLQLLCFFGNVLCLLIYRLSYFHGTTSVHFLRAKALANLIFVQSRWFEVIHAWTPVADPFFEQFYWLTRPLLISIANICGTLSTWLTLLVTVETVLCVLLPFSFRQWCTRRLTLAMLAGSFMASASLHSTFLATHSVERHAEIRLRDNVFPSSSSSSSSNGHRCFYLAEFFSMQADSPFALYETFYYWTQTAVSIVLPTLAMLICSVLIITRFTFKELGESFSQRRRCVIRLTVATTLSHLLLEGPALATFAAAALKGTAMARHAQAICMLNAGNNLLSVLNATLPFFVFLACSQQFRRMTLIFLQAQSQCEERKRRDLLASAGIARHSPATIIYERSAVLDQLDQTTLLDRTTLIVKVSNI